LRRRGNAVRSSRPGEGDAREAASAQIVIACDADCRRCDPRRSQAVLRGVAAILIGRQVQLP